MCVCMTRMHLNNVQKKHELQLPRQRIIRWASDPCVLRVLFLFFLSFFLFFFFFFFCLLRSALWHMEDPRLGVKLEL